MYESVAEIVGAVAVLPAFRVSVPLVSSVAGAVNTIVIVPVALVMSLAEVTGGGTAAVGTKVLSVSRPASRTRRFRRASAARVGVWRVGSAAGQPLRRRRGQGIIAPFMEGRA